MIIATAGTTATIGALTGGTTKQRGCLRYFSTARSAAAWRQIASGRRFIFRASLESDLRLEAEVALPTDGITVAPRICGAEKRAAFRIDLDHHLAASRFPITDDIQRMAATHQTVPNFLEKTAFKD